MTATEAVKLSSESFSIPLEHISESPSNPRQEFDAEQLKELAADIREHGVLQPVLLRPRPGKVPPAGIVPARYELVFGHRRVRAAKLAGLAAVPAMVAELDDAQVLEHQLCENLSRADLHPLEEGDGYQRLHQEHGLSAEEIAARVGKSREWVYARMKLCALQGAGRKAFLAGTINASVAILLARVPNLELQEAAAEEVLSRGGSEYTGSSYVTLPMTARAAAAHIQKHYMLKLSEAPFDRKSAELVPDAGPCSTCPKRTGAQPEVFSDVKSADVCTDPPCFNGKVTAHKALQRAAIREKGMKLLPEKASRAVFGYDDQVRPDAEFVDLKAKVEGDKKGRTWKKLLEEPDTASEGLSVVVARDGRGKLRELVAREELREVLKKSGSKVSVAPAATPLGSSSGRWQADRDEEQRKERAHQDLVNAVLAKVVPEKEATEPTTAFWREIANAILEQTYETDVFQRRGFQSKIHLAEATEKMSEAELRGLVWELCLPTNIRGLHSGPKLLKALAERHGIDLKAVQAERKAAVAGEKTRSPEKGQACGCTEDNACPGGCCWVDEAENLCSECGVKAVVEVEKPAKRKAKKGGGR